MPKITRNRKKPSSRRSSAASRTSSANNSAAPTYILGMHLGGPRVHFQLCPQKYSDAAIAKAEARRKHEKYNRAFLIFKLIAKTSIKPGAVQLELFE